MIGPGGHLFHVGCMETPTRGLYSGDLERFGILSFDSLTSPSATVATVVCSSNPLRSRTSSCWCHAVRRNQRHTAIGCVVPGVRTRRIGN